MHWKERIESRPGVVTGKPVIRGTRITVELVLEHLANGATEEYLLVNYPRLTHEDILACLQLAFEDQAGTSDMTTTHP